MNLQRRFDLQTNEALIMASINLESIEENELQIELKTPASVQTIMCVPQHSPIGTVSNTIFTFWNMAFAIAPPKKRRVYLQARLALWWNSWKI